MRRLGAASPPTAKVRSVYHLAAIYNLAVPLEVAQRVNVDGTGNVLELCERIFVLDSGEIIEVGPPRQIRSSDAVRHAYMGTQRDEIIPALAAEQAATR